jgi:hypothetical protein
VVQQPFRQLSPSGHWAYPPPVAMPSPQAKLLSGHVGGGVVLPPAQKAMQASPQSPPDLFWSPSCTMTCKRYECPGWKRRLLFGHLPLGPRGDSSLRRREGLQGHRGRVQEIHRLLRRCGRVQRRQPLPGGQRLSNGWTAMRAGHGLLLRRVCAQPHRQAGLPRFLRSHRRPLHGQRGLLHGRLRRFSRALLAA